MLHIHGQPLKNSDQIKILHSYATRTSRRSLIDEQRAVPQACEQEVRSLFQTQDRRSHSVRKVKETLSRCVHAPIDQNTVEKANQRRMSS